MIFTEIIILPYFSYFAYMALTQIIHGSEEYHKMVKLRHEILRQPLGLHFSSEELDREKNDILIGAFEDERILGCCLLTEVNMETTKLRQMAVAKKKQGSGIGHSLMSFAESLARDRGYKKIMMHARDSAIGFYERHGYEVKGSQFIEISIAHHVMEKMI